jgi:hypothetical protein
MIAKGYKDDKLVLQIEKDSVTQSDADFYSASIDRLELGDGTTLTPAPLPEPDPLAGTFELFTDAVVQAQSKIIMAKTKCLGAMVAFAGYTRDDAVAEGVRFATSPLIKDAISSYEIAGGHPAAAATLIAVVLADPSPWLQVSMGEGGPPIAAIFAATL